MICMRRTNTENHYIYKTLLTIISALSQLALSTELKQTIYNDLYIKSAQETSSDPPFNMFHTQEKKSLCSYIQKSKQIMMTSRQECFYFS